MGVVVKRFNIFLVNLDLTVGSKLPNLDRKNPHEFPPPTPPSKRVRTGRFQRFRLLNTEVLMSRAGYTIKRRQEWLPRSGSTPYRALWLLPALYGSALHLFSLKQRSPFLG
jgi:hypothetical protein